MMRTSTRRVRRSSTRWASTSRSTRRWTSWAQPEDANIAGSLADRFMFQDYYRDRSPESLGKDFGPQFALAVAKLVPGSWQGPIESGFGWHLVFVDTAIPGRVPAFEEIEPDVKTSWLSEQKAQTWDKAYKEMRAKYKVMLPAQLTITDVLVRVEQLDGGRATEIVRPSRPWLEIAPSRGTLATAGAFLVQGIDYVALGADHLLFVLGLLLLVRTPWMLVNTIAAFTIAHSITLAIAALGYASIPVPPLNAATALSILFLGPEIIRAQRGDTSFTLRHPWVVAFAFGLLHGFGFASGLITVGLPQGDIPLALLTFNVGIEIGQLCFVALMLSLARLFRVLELRWPQPVELLPAYAVGSLGAFWTIQRVVLMAHGG